MTKLEELQAEKDKILKLEELLDENSDKRYYREGKKITELRDDEIVSMNMLTEAYKNIIIEIYNYIEYLKGKEVEVSDVVETEASAGLVIYEDVSAPIDQEGGTIQTIIEDAELSSLMPYIGEGFVGNIKNATLTSDITIVREDDNSPVSFNATILKLNPRTGTRILFTFNDDDDISLLIPQSEIQVDDIYLVGIRIMDIFSEYTNLILSGRVSIKNNIVSDAMVQLDYEAYVGTRGVDIRSYITPLYGDVNRVDYWSILGKKNLEISIEAKSGRSVSLYIGNGTLNIGGEIVQDRISSISIGRHSIDIEDSNYVYNSGRGSDYATYDGKYSLYSSSTDRAIKVIYKNLVPFDKIMEGVIDEL